jgi:hypothetical protein
VMNRSSSPLTRIQAATGTRQATTQRSSQSKDICVALLVQRPGRSSQSFGPSTIRTVDMDDIRVP